MALTEVYVDPSIAADSGTGTIGDPFGDLEYAIEQTTFDTTNGTRVNIKAGTAEVLAAKLETALADTVTTVAWAGGETAQMVFQGYTAVADDGGIATIDCTNAAMFADGTADYVNCKHLHLINCGANPGIYLDETCSVIECEVEGGTATGTTTYAIHVDSGLVEGCYVHDWESVCIRSDNGVARANLIYDDGATTEIGIQAVPMYACEHNIIWFGTTHNGVGIQTASLNVGSIKNNSIYSNAGTGSGIYLTNGGIRDNISNNLIEGFSGAGGIGLRLDATNTGVTSLKGNAVYNCTTVQDGPDFGVWSEDNETLSASPFTDAANGDFSPVDTGNVFEGSLPQIIGGGLVP